MSDNKKTMLKISADVIESLKCNNISQIEIARITGKNKGTISKIFNNQYAFSMDDIKIISNELNLPVVGIITKNIYGNLESMENSYFNKLQKAEETLTKNLKKLSELKDGKNKAAS